jgi:hypothetical protein
VSDPGTAGGRLVALSGGITSSWFIMIVPGLVVQKMHTYNLCKTSSIH